MESRSTERGDQNQCNRCESWDWIAKEPLDTRYALYTSLVCRPVWPTVIQIWMTLMQSACAQVIPRNSSYPDLTASIRWYTKYVSMPRNGPTSRPRCSLPRYISPSFPWSVLRPFAAGAMCWSTTAGNHRVVCGIGGPRIALLLGFGVALVQGSVSRGHFIR